MSVQTFRVSASNVSFDSQPSGAGETLLMRSTDAADTMNATLSGLVAAVATAETNALTGKREVQTTAAFTSLTMAKLASSPAGTVNFYGQGAKASGYVAVNDQPANNETLIIGLTGFTQTYTFKTALTPAANEILIGADKYLTAQNICRAVNAGTGSGTSYGAGTAANSYVQAYADSGFSDTDLDGTTETTIYLRDRLAIVRLLTWAVSSTAANLAVVAPTGGSTGTLLGALTSGGYQITTAMAFNNPGLSAVLGTGLVLAATTPTSDVLYVGGKSGMLHVAAANYSSALVVTLEFSDDGTNFYSSSVTITNPDNNDLRYAFTNTEYARLNITTNANTTDSPFHAVLITG